MTEGVLASGLLLAIVVLAIVSTRVVGRRAARTVDQVTEPPRAERGSLPGHGPRLQRHHGDRRPPRPPGVREPGDRAHPRARHRAAHRQRRVRPHPSRRPRDRSSRRSSPTRDGGEVDRIELRLRHADGTWRVVEAVAHQPPRRPVGRGHRHQRARPHRPPARRSGTARGAGAVPQRVRARADRHGAHLARRPALPCQPRAGADPRALGGVELLASTLLDLTHPRITTVSRAGAPPALAARSPSCAARPALRAPRRTPGVGGAERVARARREGQRRSTSCARWKTSPSGGPAAKRSRTRRSTTRSPACPTDCCSSSASVASWRVPTSARAADRGAVPRPRPLQGRERQPRPLGRRPPAGRGGRPPERARCARPTSSPASAATSSRSSATNVTSEETVELIAERHRGGDRATRSRSSRARCS